MFDRIYEHHAKKKGIKLLNSLLDCMQQPRETKPDTAHGDESERKPINTEDDTKTKLD